MAGHEFLPPGEVLARAAGAGVDGSAQKTSEVDVACRRTNKNLEESIAKEAIRETYAVLGDPYPRASAARSTEDRNVWQHSSPPARARTTFGGRPSLPPRWRRCSAAVARHVRERLKHERLLIMVEGDEIGRAPGEFCAAQRSGIVPETGGSPRVQGVRGSSFLVQSYAEPLELCATARPSRPAPKLYKKLNSTGSRREAARDPPQQVKCADIGSLRAHSAGAPGCFAAIPCI